MGQSSLPQLCLLVPITGLALALVYVFAFTCAHTTHVTRIALRLLLRARHGRCVSRIYIYRPEAFVERTKVYFWAWVISISIYTAFAGMRPRILFDLICRSPRNSENEFFYASLASDISRCWIANKVFLVVINDWRNVNPFANRKIIVSALCKKPLPIHCTLFLQT